MTLSPAPTASEALAYAIELFTNVQGIPIVLCGTIAPGRDSSGPVEGTRDVLFLLPGETRPTRLTIWTERPLDEPAYLYGEW